MQQVIKIKNDSGAVVIWAGKEFALDEEYTIPTDSNRAKWQNNSTLLTAIANGDALVGDGEIFFSDVNEAVNWLKGNIVGEVIVTTQPEQYPFASKILPDGKKIYRRVRGVSANLTSATTTIDYVIPYVSCKITGLQVINGKIGDTANFKVMDTAAGTVTGIPNYLLNQFGFDVNMIPVEANYPSKYDSDLFTGLVLRLEYTSVVEDPVRTIYINFDLHEVKD